MKPKSCIVGLGCVAVGVAAILWLAWKRDEARREALAALQRLQDSLASPAPAGLVEILVPPVTLRTRTIAEQDEFIRKALGMSQR